MPLDVLRASSRSSFEVLGCVNEMRLVPPEALKRLQMSSQWSASHQRLKASSYHHTSQAQVGRAQGADSNAFVKQGRR